jgi:hypothetical protein
LIAARSARIKSAPESNRPKRVGLCGVFIREGIFVAEYYGRRPGQLDYAEHDRADKGECDIGGENAHSADDSHGNSPWLTPLPNNRKNSGSFPGRKVSLAVYCHFPTAGTVVKTS